MAGHFLLWLQALLALSLFSTLTARAKAGPRGHPDPWDWQNQNSVFTERPPDSMSKAPPDQPDFLPGGHNITVRVGEPAVLPCGVKNLVKHYTVSWIRARDVTVLSVGRLTFSSDQRLSVVEVPYPRMEASDWSLRIVNASEGDQGVYECQVNTDPKIHRKFHLSVTKGSSPPPGSSPDSPYYDVDQASDPRGGGKLNKHRHLRTGPDMAISGGPVQYVSQGMELGLDCRVSRLITPPRVLRWERRGKALTAKERPGLSLETERLAGVSRVSLYLAQSELQDTGNYTCVSDDGLRATVLLVVTVGYEIPPKGLKEAGFRSGGPALCLPTYTIALLLSFSLSLSLPLPTHTLALLISLSLSLRLPSHILAASVLILLTSLSYQLTI